MMKKLLFCVLIFLPILQARQLTKAKSTMARNVFYVLDHDKTGSIDKYVLVNILSTFGLLSKVENPKGVFEEIDTNGNGQVELDEFVKSAERFLDYVDDDSLTKFLREGFLTYDEEHEGSVKTEVLSKILRGINRNYTQDEVAKILALIDVDGSKTVTFEELLAALVREY